MSGQAPLQGSAAPIRMVLCPCGALADAEHPERLIHRGNCPFDRFKEQEVEVVPLSVAEALADALEETCKVVANDGTWLWAHRKLAEFRAAHPKPEPAPEEDTK